MASDTTVAILNGATSDYRKLLVDASGYLLIAAGGGSLTISGAVTITSGTITSITNPVAVTQSGTWAVDSNLQVGDVDVSNANPVPISDAGSSITVDGVPELTVTNAISATAYDINGGAYSASSALSNDYILDHIQFNFSTTQSRDITITLADGTILWSVTGDTSLDILIEDIEKAFNAGDDFTIDITQTAGACTVDVLATVREGMSTLGGASAVGTVISGNSSTTLLTTGSTFTGSWVDVSAYDSITVAVKTDQDGTYVIQFSPDSTNIDSSLTRYYRTAQIEPPHRFTITRRYMRITFTNTSASDQTYFRLQTLAGNKAQLNIPIDSTMSQDYDSLSVRPTEFRHEAGLGRRQGVTLWNKFGYNSDVDIGTEVVAAFGGTFTPMTTARTLSVVSTSTNDTNGGTGANTVLIYGVDANRDAQTVSVTMNGTTPVVTTETWLGVNRIAITSSGSGQVNAGIITATATTDATVQAHIPAGEGTTQQCIFFTQQNHQALAEWLTINTVKPSGQNPIVTIKGWVYSAVTSSKYEVFRHVMDTTVQIFAEFRPTLPFVIGEKSCFWLEATTDKNDTVVSARFSLLEYRDVDA